MARSLKCMTMAYRLPERRVGGERIQNTQEESATNSALGMWS